ncbi:flavin-containing monooxygenase [Deinococcus yavapaiensis]|uniref:Putative flavoprotein involved in K+ transport n=1 Tax=Deinococcus yavapaiensis KR-236 TaxID=694435 RepID=A0A318S4F6_9DEIO|nr:NAD(P)/FAD-dependent oxidoreductase [Deinococcus yavapaiensis]PYE53306.1 putative flavoprotein involved in K+ transport [Deinococcus yavapaiensis KR-236]
MSRVFDAVIVGAGPSGLATAYHLANARLDYTVLETGRRPTGSWPSHYDSLTLFSPARHSALPGLAYFGDPDRYPTRDEVIAYLERYALTFGLRIELETYVQGITRAGATFTVHADDGRTWRARNVIAATGAFRRPFVPIIAGRSAFQGLVLHSSAYRRPADFEGKRVIVVGSANSAVQIGVELARVARVTLAVRRNVRWVPQRIFGRDILDWAAPTHVEHLPLGRFGRLPTPTVVYDTGKYRAAFERRHLDQRSMFERFSRRGVVWPNGTEEQVDVVVFATGYRPNLEFLRGLGALDDRGEPYQRLGLSTRVPGLYYVGLPGQRSTSSGTLRGAGLDAAFVVRALQRRR